MEWGTVKLTTSRAKGTAFAAALAAVCALGVAGCAPQANEGAAQAGAEEAPAVQVDFTWSADADCATCHAQEQDSFDDATCGAALHADVVCATCHADASALATAHEGATADKAAKAALKATVVDPATCESASCHVRDEIVAATADSAVLTDTKGTTVNPHALPESDDHAGLTCTNCHQMHVADANVQKKAQRACASCHHADVYECYTCHS